jgi:hypothetical protein
MAYPYGDVDARVMAAARQAGYVAAAGLEWSSGRPDRYRYPRIGIYRKDTMTRFRFKTGSLARSRYGSRLLAMRQRHADPV